MTKFLPKVLPVFLCFALVFNASCFSQSTLSALVSTLGNASASIAKIEGDPSLATKLQADTAAASTAILNWKKGTDATEVLEVVNIVMDDLNLIPISDATTIALVDLALGTVESIVTIITSEAAPTIAAGHVLHQNRVVHLAHVPKNSSQFASQWYALAKNDSKYSNVVLYK